MKFKRLFSLFVLPAVLLPSIFAILPSSVALAENNSTATDTERRKLVNFKNCITYGSRDNSNIDVRRDFDDPIDPIGNTIDDDNVILGLDMNPQGHQNCTVSIIDGINVLYGDNTVASDSSTDKQKEIIGTWLVKYLTGRSFGVDPTQRKKDESGWSTKLEYLKGLIDDRINSIGRPSYQLLQTRFNGLLDICYDAYPIGSAPRAIVDDNGFQVSGVGVFFRKDGSDIFNNFIKPNAKQDNSKIYKPNSGWGSETGVEIGSWDLQQSWDGFKGEIFGKNGWGDFYPIGKDLDYIDIGLYRGSIAECEVIENDAVKAFLFKDVIVNPDGALTSTITNTIIPVNNSTTTDEEQSDKPTCESVVGGFGWLMCPVLGYIDSFIGWAEDSISNQLTIDLGSPETRANLQSAWQVVARIASGVLVAVALVMVISTALGSDLVSPYALKKVLPRLVIGAIGIWLSWALVTTYIDIMNDIGRGISGILLIPFEGARDINLVGILTNLGMNSGSDGTSSTIFVGLATAGLVSAGIFGILSAAVTALFAFLIAIIVLALRQAVIIFLVVLAPLGFAMWILPNTQKVWKLWSGTLNKLLLMYPMLMGVLAAGKIFAYVTSTSSDNNGSTVDEFFKFAISLIAYIAPYFFLPALFKAAGGVFSNLTGMVNDKGKGFYDRFKGGLDEKSKSRQAFKSQLKSEKQARIAAGQGMRSSFSRAGMRAKGGQPITGGVLTLRNRAAARQRVQSSMAAAQDKLEEQQIQEETARMANSGMLNNKEDLQRQALSSSSSVVQRRAAINRLMQISDDEGIRSIKSAAMASSDNRVRDMWGKVQSSKELVDAFKDSAPDILRGEAAFSGGMNTAMLTKAAKGTFAQATSQYKEANRLLSGLSSGAIAPESLSGSQASLLGAYVDKTPEGKLILNAASLTNGVNKLQNAVKITAASAKEATTNPALRADFKVGQATEALKMLETLDTTFAGVASVDIAAVRGRIDPTTGLR